MIPTLNERIRTVIKDALYLLLLNKETIQGYPDGLSRDEHEERAPHYSWVRGLKYFRCHLNVTSYIKKYVHAELVKQKDQAVQECDDLDFNIESILSPLFLKFTGIPTEPMTEDEKSNKSKQNLYSDNYGLGIERWALLQDILEALSAIRNERKLFAFEIKTLVMVEAENEEEAFDNLPTVALQTLPSFAYDRSPEDDSDWYK